MHYKRRAFPIIVLPLIAILLAVLTSAPDQYAYAKGVKRSDDSSDRSPSRSDDDRSSTSSDRSSGSSDRSRPERDKTPPPTSDRAKESSTERAPTRLKATTSVIHPDPMIKMGNIPPFSWEREDGSSAPRGSYRKDYADIGRIWKQRQERRSTMSHDWRGSYRKHSDHDTHFRLSFYFPGRYTHYVYDYVPGYCCPSVYCYYYGLFPPYIHRQRVIYIRHDPYIRYTYVDLPITILDSRPYTYEPDYLYPNGYNSVASTLRDIRRAWERGDVDLLMGHVRLDSTIDVHLKGEYAYSLHKADYREMTYDAMRSIQTVSFEFYRVRERSSHEVVAYAKHVYCDDYDRDYFQGYADGYYLERPKSSKAVYVSFTLTQRGSDWYITEVGSSPYKLY